MLHRPIIQDEKRLQVGYNEEEIRSFYSWLRVDTILLIRYLTR